MKDKGILSYANSNNIDVLNFANKMEDENIQNKLASLFSKQDDLGQKDTDEVSKSLDDPYMTVNEGLTTDTAFDDSDSEHAAESKLNESLSAQGIIPSDQEKGEEPGIQSSDDETQKSKTVVAPTYSAQTKIE